MKPSKDLIISRKELQDWQSNLVWGRDGTLYITSYPDICIAQPIYEKELESNVKRSFHVKDYILDYVNKFEYESAGTNSLLNSQPISYGRLVRPSPVSSLLAVLTSNLNVNVFHRQEMLVNIDEENRDLKSRSYHSVEWAPEGRRIAVGNENGEILIFAIEGSNKNNVESHLIANIQLDESERGWVNDICWKDNLITACLDDNSVYLINIAKDFAVQQMAPPSRFKIADLCLFGKYILTTDSCLFRRIDVVSGDISTVSLGIGEDFYIIPSFENTGTISLISNKTSCKINVAESLKLMPDDVISPILERKFKRWSLHNNEFNKYETTMFLYGLSLSPDGYSVALMYSMERISFKYRIASENQFYVTFIPLCDSWNISKRATGLAWYQTYQIYDCTLPAPKKEAALLEENDNTYNVGMPFKEYLNALISNEKMSILRFFNFVEDVPSVQLFRRALFEYAVANRSNVENLLDKASIQSLAKLLNLESPVDAELVEVKSEFISETFDFKKDSSAESIISEQGHSWRRCAVSLLPILTTKVKICPISKQRIIDITRDELNQYGWFTRTLLEILNDESIYSGTSMISV